MTEETEPESQMREAEALLEAAWNTPNEKRYDQLISWVREIIEPLAESNYPPAIWLQTCLPYDTELSEEEVDRLHREQLKKAASLGNIEAKFRLAVDLDEEPTIETSAILFKEAAEAGHAYAMWCHGLNLLSGRGVKKNESNGYKFIHQSAELKFEGAIQFVAEAYANGSHGYNKDLEASALWRKKLSSPDLTTY
jgi:hypothetical protein